ncbi:Crp/Fnr family transcriptional regulator [Pelosinus fermentans]|uniref:Transcriptional regulator, Crp/Fnr family n=1 Tax=Pelosinus fermentans JBW45 TaxID=1192197 RepID=I8TZG0_9FIRM|nr:Crp/Fnr family transcriptional regulator [Pelosinus fermentans]AJQ29107.1 transcriptional regulator, Crp/Fnr family [Pelosinus fermentans JBW45]
MQFDDFLFSEPQLKELLIGMPEKIRAKVSLKKIPAGETLLKKGEKVEYAYILIGGELKVINEFENGRIYIFERIRPISFVSELEILAGEMEYVSTVETVNNCKVLMITAKDFAKWIACDHAVLLKISQILAKKMYSTASKTGTANFLSGIRKIQTYIIKYYQENQGNIDVLLIDKKRQQIADEIGVSVKTINRCVDKLNSAGLVFVRSGKIYISKGQYANLLLEIQNFK